ncbi:MAG TPA: hypothetical protein VIV11_12810 [Kofleriaceae bacterium]
MDLDRSELEIIDEYISDALAATGTRRAPRYTQPMQLVREPEPLPADLEPQTEPLVAPAAHEIARAIVIDERNADASLLAQVAQQLAQSEPVEPLPRGRAPRSTADLDDEVTNIVRKPDSKPI